MNKPLTLFFLNGKNKQGKTICAKIANRKLC